MMISRRIARAASLALFPHLAAADVTYVEADTGNQPGSTNTTYADGSTFTPSTNGSAAPANNAWHERTGFANESDVLASNAGSDSPTLRTTVSGLAPGASYNVTLYYWVAGDGVPTGNNQWDITTGLTQAGMVSYVWDDGTQITDPGHFDSGVLLTEGNRRLFEIDLGPSTASAAGTIDIFVDDYPGNDDRTWYDGVGTESLAPGVAYCFGDGGGTVCPCGNPGGLGAGCANGTGAGAGLVGTGSTSIAAGDLVLAGSDLVPTQPGLYFQGDNAVNGGAGIVFGDGLRCAGGNVVRLEIRAADGSGVSQTSIDVGVAGGVSAGDLKRYQLWYRDPATSPCGTTFNLSNGYEVTYTP